MKRLTYTGWRGSDFGGDVGAVEPNDDPREFDDETAAKLLASGQWRLAAAEAKEPEPTVTKPAEKE